MRGEAVTSGLPSHRHFTWTCLVLRSSRQCTHCVTGRPFFLISIRGRVSWLQVEDRWPVVSNLQTRHRGEERQRVKEIATQHLRTLNTGRTRILHRIDEYLNVGKLNQRGFCSRGVCHGPLCRTSEARVWGRKRGGDGPNSTPTRALLG